MIVDIVLSCSYICLNIQEGNSIRATESIASKKAEFKLGVVIKKVHSSLSSRDQKSEYVAFSSRQLLHLKVHIH